MRAGGRKGMARGRRVRQPRARRRLRGQAIVEFALVAPLLFLVIFGVVEFALISTSISAFNFAAKDAARLGSLLGHTQADVDCQMVALIQQRVAGVVMAQTLQVEIFKSDESGSVDTTTAPENVYSLQGFTEQDCRPARQSNGVTVGWPVGARNDTQINADYLGVKITYQYTYLTAFVSGNAPNLLLTATSVQRIEPTDYLGERSTPRRPARRGPALAGGPLGGPLAPGGVADAWLRPSAHRIAQHTVNADGTRSGGAA